MFNIENKSYAYFTRDSSPNSFKFDAINDQFEKRDNTSGWDVIHSDDETISVDEVFYLVMNCLYLSAYYTFSYQASRFYGKQKCKLLKSV